MPIWILCKYASNPIMGPEIIHCVYKDTVVIESNRYDNGEWWEEGNHVYENEMFSSYAAAEEEYQSWLNEKEKQSKS